MMQNIRVSRRTAATRVIAITSQSLTLISLLALFAVTACQRLHLLLYRNRIFLWFSRNTASLAITTSHKLPRVIKLERIKPPLRGLSIYLFPKRTHFFPEKLVLAQKPTADHFTKAKSLLWNWRGTA